MKPNPICITKKNSDLRMREREILRRKGLMKSHNKPMLRIPPLLVVTLSVRAFLSFFLLSMSLLCVCTCSLFVFLPSFSFFFLCVPLSIYREIPKKLFHYFSLNWSIHRVVFVSFSSTTPNFMFSRDPLFSFSIFFFFFPAVATFSAFYLRSLLG